MNDYDITVLADLFAVSTGVRPDDISRLPGAGSNRRYYRLTHGGDTLIGVAGKSREENNAFIYLSGHFREKGLPVPEVKAISADGMYYIQQDLGNVSLFDTIRQGRTTGEWSTAEIDALRRAIEILPELQWRGAEGLDFSRCHPIPSMDSMSVMWDLNYFKYCFLKSTGIEVDEPSLEKDFLKLSEMLLATTTETFMMRDCQSRNVMLDASGKPWLIDFQGGRKGPIHYDVASMLWQAKARIPNRLKDELIDAYIEASRPYADLNPDSFKTELKLFVLFRTLQVLGAYGFRGYVERKPHFLESIPDAIANLRELIADGISGLPYLSYILNEITGLEQFNASSKPQRSDILTVKVSSFGFRKSGIPSDDSGNGGGYVFDCRALHNPGRYTEYRHLTGMDQPVIDFLESDGKITDFLEHVFALVDNSVECYLNRGFTDLSVSFGCTGGQHRSVYCAEKMASHLHYKYPCLVRLQHIEQGIDKTIEPSTK